MVCSDHMVPKELTIGSLPGRRRPRSRSRSRSAGGEKSRTKDEDDDDCEMARQNPRRVVRYHQTTESPQKNQMTAAIAR